jgi:hypothetical protein
MSTTVGIRQLLPIDEVDYDANNPRIQLAFHQGKERNEANIKLALNASSPDEENATGTTIRGLKTSIKANGGIIQPIIVKREANGRYLVVEGNTRLMIYNEFHAKGFPGTWDEIPSIVYDNIDESTVDAIRLQSHLVGPRQWSPYAKASYLAGLEQRGDVPWEDIVSFCGGSSRDVDELVSAYQDMERHYRALVDGIPGERFDPSRFSTFVVLQQRRVSQSIYDAGFDKDDYARWVHERKIFPSQDARQIPRILGNDRAQAIFLAEGSREALNYINSQQDGNGGETIEDASLDILARELTDRLLKMTRAEESALKEDPDGDVSQLLIGLESELVTLCSVLRE